MKRIVYSLLLLFLISCKDDDVIPTSLMDFELVEIFEAYNVHNAGGFIASEELNSLFVASREPNPDTERLGERLLRYDVSDGSITSDYTDITDFVTKEIHIRDNDIVVIAGTFVNTYDINFEKEPTTVEHGLSLSRFGSALYEGDIYIWGGDLNDQDSDKIKKWNEGSGTFETVATLPARKAGAHGEVIDDKLYIFGGQEHWILEPPNDVIFIYDFNTGVTETANLPQEVFRTFTDVYEGKIFIAGQLLDQDSLTQDLDIFFAVFDPKDNSTREIETSLNDGNFRTIHQMAVLRDEIYVLYGDVGRDFGRINLMKHQL